MSGAGVLDEMAGKDLNKSGKIINLVICGNSQYYDFSFIEDKLDEWVDEILPDMAEESNLTIHQTRAVTAYVQAVLSAVK